MAAIVQGSERIAQFCRPIAEQLGLEVVIRELPRANSIPGEYLSVAITRSPHGQVVSYPAMRHNYHRKRLCTEPVTEDSISMNLQESAISAARDNQLIGSAIARFTKSLELVEFATGLSHEALWTLDFALISQFENEVRSAHDLPLGSSNMLITDWLAIEYSAPIELDMKSPYLHLFAHDPSYQIRQFTSHTGIVLAAGRVDLFNRVAHAVDYLEGVVNE